MRERITTPLYNYYLTINVRDKDRAESQQVADKAFSAVLKYLAKQEGCKPGEKSAGIVCSTSHDCWTCGCDGEKNILVIHFTNDDGKKNPLYPGATPEVPIKRILDAINQMFDETGLDVEISIVADRIQTEYEITANKSSVKINTVKGDNDTCP